MEFDKVEILVAFSVMSTVVVALWRLLMYNAEREENRLKKYEELHAKAQEQVIAVSGDYRELKGRMDGVENLSKSVLDTIEGMNR